MIWLDAKGKTVSCHEKLKILNQNLEELQSLNLSFQKLTQTAEYKDALEDAILLGISKLNFDCNLQIYLTEYKK